MRTNFPEFEVSVGVDFANPFVVSMVLALKCTRCGETHFVFEDSWREGAGISGSTQTRSCPYCMKASRPPTKEEDEDGDRSAES